jgi:anti-sigma regulatory factor (Ser/Thr protein kinase)
MRLRTEIEPGLPSIRMDENAMTLVLLNLVDNAVKYAADGKDVDVSLKRTPGGISLAVRDWGPGIPVDEQPRIFERFYRAQAARDRNVRGSGIGLALVKHIVEAHGGRLSVTSVPGQGATFTVVLPAAPPTTGRAREPVLLAATSTASVREPPLPAAERTTGAREPVMRASPSTTSVREPVLPAALPTTGAREPTELVSSAGQPDPTSAWRPVKP